MEADSTREMALDMPGTAVKERHGKPSYSVKKKTFMTVWAMEQRAVLKLTLDQCASLMEEFPDCFRPVQNNMGRHGWTDVSLAHVPERLLRYVIDLAWRNVAPKWLIPTRTPPPKG